MTGIFYQAIESFSGNFDMFDKCQSLWKNEQRFVVNPYVISIQMIALY
jgi:hypothetical protein